LSSVAESVTGCRGLLLFGEAELADQVSGQIGQRGTLQ
jgi:hypothetical protein